MYAWVRMDTIESEIRSQETQVKEETKAHGDVE
jgi:hypothetical protein